MARILVIDDERSIALTCRRILEPEGHTVDTCLSGLEGVERASLGPYDLVLLDLKMPDLPGMEALERIRSRRPEVLIVIITGYATIQTSIEAIKRGAFDYVPKPFTPDELSLAVNRALEDKRLRSENAAMKDEIARLTVTRGLIGRSRLMEEVNQQIRKVAGSDFTVTLHGESGTGKEVVARALHDLSGRANGPFVAVDCSALSPGLVESELFGHVRGAFTGATGARPGYFAAAQGGTLFLDEISNISLELQGKLLRVIETRQVHPVGSEKEVEVDVRLIVASNRDLREMCNTGAFRRDLFYRLNVIPIHLPPLHERAEDIPLLAMHFLEEARKNSRTPLKGFSSEAMARLLAWGWPGNVRELKNVVERLVATVDSDLIRLEHLPLEMRTPATPPGSSEEAPTNVEELKEAKRRVKEAVYAQVEKAFIWHALEQTGWNVTRAAQNVGMARPNFLALMRRYGIRARDDSEV